VLKDPVLNKGTAFSATERHALGLEGLLPQAVETLDEQLRRVRVEYDTKRTDLGRHIFLRQLQDASRVLFYRFVVDHLEEVLPVVYTPTVGEACERFSSIYRRPHGLFVAYPDIDDVDEMLDNAAPDDVRIIVVTDGERILGLGDQGVGGMGIPIGKLALYTACGGIHPSCTLPVFLDVGTNNPAALADPLYLGWRHERIDGDAYDRFVDAFVEAVRRRFPNVLLQWEDFAQRHATALLDRYRARICSFNDDIQGTAAVAVAAVLAGAADTGSRLADQRIVIVGAGSAGTGIGAALVRAMVVDGLSDADARRRLFLVDRDGLLHDGMTGLLDFQRALAQPAGAVTGWATFGSGGPIALREVVEHAEPTVLIGVSGQPGLFTEPVVRAMAARVDRPIILPLSNPTSRAEATPAQVMAWTDRRALVATGSPFPDVDQANNVHVFPGLGLGVLASHAAAVTDGMLTAAASAIASLAPSGSLLPPVSAAREVSRVVAVAVGLAAVADGVAAPVDRATLTERVAALVWEPRYAALVPAAPAESTVTSPR
jgi:malate dehydrogenase (oxaloacetate-decarboxylating)